MITVSYESNWPFSLTQFWG